MVVKMTLEEKIAGMLRDMGSRDLVFMWNDYCDSNRYDDDYIFSMAEFDDMFYGVSPLGIAEAVCNGDGFSPDDKYFKHTLYGLTSSDDPEYSGMIDVDDLAEWIVKTGNALNNDEIRDALDAADDDEESEEGEE